MKISNLTLSFGNKIVLKNINLDIESGDFVFFIGHSGS
jgi:ABC-type sugar transport system ATPase subunit